MDFTLIVAIVLFFSLAAILLLLKRKEKENKILEEKISVIEDELAEAKLLHKKESEQIIEHYEEKDVSEIKKELEKLKKLRNNLAGELRLLLTVTSYLKDLEKELKYSRNKFFDLHIRRNDLEELEYTNKETMEIVLESYKKLAFDYDLTYSDHKELIKKIQKTILFLIEHAKASTKFIDESFNVNPQSKSINIVEILTVVLNRYNIFITLKKLTLIKNIKDDEILLEIDPHLIEDVLDSIIGNFIKLCDEESKIAISCKDENNKLNLSIKILGLGFSDKQISEIMEFGENLDKFSDNVLKEFHLQKLISIIEAHKGRLQFRSKENEESEFLIILPK